jgi:flagellar assembly protein FliH
VTQCPTIQLQGRPAQVRVEGPAAFDQDPGGAGANGGTNVQAGPAPDLQKLLEKERGELKLARLALESGVERLRRLEAEWAAQAHQQVADLAVAVAAKVLAQEIKAQRVEIDPIVQAALERLPTGGETVVRMHPADLERSRFARAEGEAASPIRAVADATVKRAECLIETPHGFIQVDIESHLRALAEALRTPE